jgi:hypothetical protein|tara:strand:+ start:707 stop:874 length:168 start_codon:yes stop_codon:yes gene_type:complete
MQIAKQNMLTTSNVSGTQNNSTRNAMHAKLNCEGWKPLHSVKKPSGVRHFATKQN